MNELMLQQFIAGVGQWLLNKALTLDVTSAAKLAELEQKSLTVTLTELGFPLTLTVSQGKVYLSSVVQDACAISCDLSALKQLNDAQALTQLIKQDKLTLQGDLKIAQAFANLFNELELDWETELAKHIGEQTVHQLRLLLVSGKRKLAFASKQIQQDSSEWVLHEAKLCPHAVEIDDFVQHVSHIERQTDALTQRVNRLLATK